MENQNTRKRRKSVTIILIAGVGLVLAVVGIMKYEENANSRPSTAAEVQAQEQFQKKLLSAQEEYRQKVEAARKEAEKE
jgi:hypothetical protein